MKDSIIIMQHPWWAVETWEEDEERFIKGQNKLKLEKVNNEVKIKAVIWSLPRYPHRHIQRHLLQARWNIKSFRSLINQTG